MAFGKKPGPPKSPSAPIISERNLQALEDLDLPKRPQVAAEKIAQRLIPEELFDPATQGGRLMAALGFSPDDESNVVKTDDALRERMEKDRHRMLAFIDQINGGLPDGVNVAPYLMIPEACWGGPCGGFLLRYLELTPYGVWNMLPLPRDQRSATELGIRMHPGPSPKSFVANVEGVLMKISGEVETAGDAFGKQIETRGKPDWDGMADIVDLSRRKVRGTAWAITSQVLGQNTLRRPRELFYNENFDAMPSKA